MKFRLSKREYTGPQGGVRGWRTHPRRLRPLGVAAGVVLASVVVPVAVETAGAGGCSLTSMSGSYGTGWAVGTEADLQKVGTECPLGDYYYQTADITLTPPAPGGSNHTPIGSLANPFTGVYDGYNYTINGLVINRPGSTDQGFFGAIGEWGEIDNVKFTNVSITADDQSGLIAGSAVRGYVYAVEASGSVNVGDSGGGFIGKMTSGNISYSKSSLTVTGGSKVGGFVGEGLNKQYSSSGAWITESTFDGTLTASGDYAGGIIGHSGYYSRISDNVVSGDVSSSANYLGGLIGYSPGAFAYASTVYKNKGTGSVSSSGSYVGGAFGGVASLGYGEVNTVTADITVTGSGSNVGGYAGDADGGSFEFGVVIDGTVSAPNASRVGGVFGSAGAVGMNAMKSEVDVTGGSDVGGLVGYLKSYYYGINNSISSGTVTATSNGGGLVGTMDGTYFKAVNGNDGTGAVIKKSKSVGAVTVGSVGGGLVGRVISGSNVIENSYSRSTVSGGGPVGGLIGKLDSGTDPGALTLKNSYSMGAVTASSGTGGGLVGSVEAGSAITPTALFWDTETSGQATSADGTGKSTTQMTTRSTFADASWDIAAGFAAGQVWGICKNNDGYPYLSWEGGSSVVCMTKPTEVTASPGDGEATISFTPGDDFGSTITNYEYQLDGGSWTALSPSDGTSPITITGLTNDTQYKVKIRAVNSLGKSPESDEVTVTPAVPKAPDAPTSLSATALDTGTKISFTAGADNGSAITNYEYQLDGGSWVAFSPADASSPVIIFGLTNDTQYSIKLRAVNSVGNSDPSDPVSATPAAAPVPDGATLPELTPGSRQVVVDGTPIEVTLTVEDTTDLVLKGDGFELRLAGGCAGSACELLTDGDGHPYMQLRTSGEVEVSGYGFKPNSIVNVWIFSTATYVGKLHVDGDGKFIGTLDLPPGLAIGDHTLQVNGYTPGDAQRTANMGVVLKNDQLPATGVDSAWLMGITLVVLVAGAFLWAASGLGASGTTRRRRHSA